MRLSTRMDLRLPDVSPNELGSYKGADRVGAQLRCAITADRRRLTLRRVGEIGGGVDFVDLLGPHETIGVVAINA